ncbi:hypothetical protein [Candidatus Vidania fulgoroideorum]
MRHLKRKNFVYFLNNNKIKNIVLSIFLKKRVFLTKKISKIVFSYFNKLCTSYKKKSGKKKFFLNFIMKKKKIKKNFFNKTNFLRRKLIKIRKGDMAKIYLIEII